MNLNQASCRFSFGRVDMFNCLRPREDLDFSGGVPLRGHGAYLHGDPMLQLRRAQDTRFFA